MNKERQIAIALSLLCVPAFVIPYQLGLLPNLAELTTQVVGGAILALIGAACALWYRSESKHKNVIHNTENLAITDTQAKSEIHEQQRNEIVTSLISLERQLTDFAKAPTQPIVRLRDIESASARWNLLVAEAKSLLGQTLNAEDFRVNFGILERFVRRRIALGHLKSLASKLLGEVKSYRLELQSNEQHSVEASQLSSKIRYAHKLEHLEIRFLFPWHYYIRSWFRKIGYPYDKSNKRLLLNFKTKETCHPPKDDRDLDLLQKGIVGCDDNILFPFESLKKWSERHGYTYVNRRLMRAELLED